MESQYCKCGHVGSGDTCSHCARRNQLAAVSSFKAPSGAGPNATLMELRALKTMLESGLIAEAEYDERRNYILANF